ASPAAATGVRPCGQPTAGAIFTIGTPWGLGAGRLGAAPNPSVSGSTLSVPQAASPRTLIRGRARRRRRADMAFVLSGSPRIIAQHGFAGASFWRRWSGRNAREPLLSVEPKATKAPNSTLTVWPPIAFST